MSEKCLVKGCRHSKGEGRFVGDLCAPCNAMLTTGVVDVHGQTFVHDLWKKSGHTKILTEKLDKHYEEISDLLQDHLGFNRSKTVLYAKRYAIIRDTEAHNVPTPELYVVGRRGPQLRQGDDLDNFLDSQNC